MMGALPEHCDGEQRQGNMQGLLLGLSSGTVCIAYCAPVLVPYLLGEGRNTRRNFFLLTEFLLGRLTGYLLFGILAWVTGRMLMEKIDHRGLILGLIYLVLSGFLASYGLRKTAGSCAARPLRSFWSRESIRDSGVLPPLLGFITGLNLCPPFLLAFTSATGAGSLAGSVLFFLFFFVGTSVYFLPAPFLGALSRFELLRTVGKLSAVVVAVYYFYVGILMFGGGIVALWATELH